MKSRELHWVAQSARCLTSRLTRAMAAVKELQLWRFAARAVRPLRAVRRLVLASAARDGPAAFMAAEMMMLVA